MATEIVRSLAVFMALIPLNGCIAPSGLCADRERVVSERIAEIKGPNRVGAAPGVTEEAFDSCIKAGDCLTLCKQNFSRDGVESCERVGTPGETDTVVTVRAQIYPLCQ
jgi:hypothetical protein